MDAHDFDPLEQPAADPRESTKIMAPKPPSGEDLEEKARLIQARGDAFRDIADRFYMLWWNLPGMTTRQADQDVRDLFRMFMELAPSLGVSRSGIPELRECCGRKRVWPDEPVPPGDQIVVTAPVRDEKLGWCPGDLIRRFTRMLGVGYCEKCDRRRRAINRFFRCGSSA